MSRQITIDFLRRSGLEVKENGPAGDVTVEIEGTEFTIEQTGALSNKDGAKPMLIAA